jgi:hypothetical protein
MARIQVLPLPTAKVGDYETTPFLLILDQTNRHDEDWPDELLDHLKDSTGALMVLAHEATIDAPGALQLTEDEKQQLHDRLLAPAPAEIYDYRYTEREPHVYTAANSEPDHAETARHRGA